MMILMVKNMCFHIINYIFIPKKIEYTHLPTNEKILIFKLKCYNFLIYYFLKQDMCLLIIKSHKIYNMNKLLHSIGHRPKKSENLKPNPPFHKITLPTLFASNHEKTTGNLGAMSPPHVKPHI